jgi:hypothetical protein
VARTIGHLRLRAEGSQATAKAKAATACAAAGTGSTAAACGQAGGPREPLEGIARLAAKKQQVSAGPRALSPAIAPLIRALGSARLGSAWLGSAHRAVGRLRPASRFALHPAAVLVHRRRRRPSLKASRGVQVALPSWKWPPPPPLHHKLTNTPATGRVCTSTLFTRNPIPNSAYGRREATRTKHNQPASEVGRVTVLFQAEKSHTIGSATTLYGTTIVVCRQRIGQN